MDRGILGIACGLPLWLEEPPDEGRLREALDAMARLSGRSPAVPPSAEEAYWMGKDLLTSGSRKDADRGRCWLWVSASMGFAPSVHELASQISEAGPGTKGAPSAAVLVGLVGRWLRLAMPARSVGKPPVHVHVRDTAHAGIDDADMDSAMFETPPGHDTPEPDGTVVVERIGDPLSREGRDIAKRFQHLIGFPQPFKGFLPDPGALSRDFLGCFPWATGLARYMRGQFALLRSAGHTRLRLPPLLLVGPSGCGKTTMLEWLASYCEFASVTMPIGGTHDSAGLSAVSRGWQTGQPSAPVMAISEHGCANPVLILDELDKGVSDLAGRNGSTMGALLAMLQPPADGYRDSYLLAPVDLSNVSFMATANSLAPLSDPIRSRFIIQPVPAPTEEHFDVILGEVIENEAGKLGIRSELLPWVMADDRRWLRTAFVKSGCNIRRLEQAYRILAGDRAAEEESAMCRPN